jgi:hypothetical protein
MSIRSTVVTVGTTPTFLSAGGQGAGELRTIIVRNDSGFDVFIGGDDVTTSNGMRLPSGSDKTLDLDVGDNLYACVSSGTQPVQMFRTRV